MTGGRRVAAGGLAGADLAGDGGARAPGAPAIAPSGFPRASSRRPSGTLAEGWPAHSSPRCCARGSGIPPAWTPRPTSPSPSSTASGCSSKSPAVVSSTTSAAPAASSSCIGASPGSRRAAGRSTKSSSMASSSRAPGRTASTPSCGRAKATVRTSPWPVFDVLAIAGRRIMREPWTARRGRLAALIGELAEPRIQLVPAEDARALGKSWVDEWGGEGIVLKDRQAPYRPGVRTPPGSR